MTGALALVGSGEYLPAMLEIEKLLLENAKSLGKSNRYIQIPTAAGQESAERLSYWKNLGAAQAERLGAEQVFLPIYNREDAMNQSFADAITGAGLIYLSGGDPGYLSRTLIDSPVLRALEITWRSGSSLAGCSAGAMAFGSHVPNFFRPKEEGTAGFSLIGEIRTIPHFDKFFKWIPESAARLLLTAPAGSTVIGIDETTALITGLTGHPELSLAARRWLVRGNGRVHLLHSPTSSPSTFSDQEFLQI